MIGTSSQNTKFTSRVMISSAILALALLSLPAMTSEAGKASIIQAINAEIAKKSKPWAELAKDTESKNYTYWQNCQTMKATHCHTYELSHRKVKGRVLTVIRTFDKACREAGGKTVDGSDPSYDEIDAFFYDNHKVVKRIHIPVMSQQLFCEFDQKPALSIFVDSERAERHGDGNLISKDALYEKPRIYVYINDLDALTFEVEEAAQINNQRTEAYEACMAAPFKIGDRSQFGLVTNVRGPLVEVQRDWGLEWVRADEVLRDFRECEAK